MRTLSLLALLFLIACPAFAVVRMPRGAYFVSPVPNQEKLRKALQDPLVARRYSRAFGIPESDVFQHLASLQLTTLQEAKVVRMYYCRPNGEWGYKLRRIKKGSQVFALPDGTPILMRVCGNPVRSAPPEQVMNTPKIKDFLPNEDVGVLIPDKPVRLGNLDIPQPFVAPPAFATPGLPPGRGAVLPPGTALPPGPFVAVAPPFAATGAPPVGAAPFVPFLPYFPGNGAFPPGTIITPPVILPVGPPLMPPIITPVVPPVVTTGSPPTPPPVVAPVIPPIIPPSAVIPEGNSAMMFVMGLAGLGGGLAARRRRLARR